jgi:hypothetical protein
MNDIRPTLRVALLTTTMFIICWGGFEVGKYLYSQRITWAWSFDRYALWRIYLMAWGVAFFVYNLVLLSLFKAKNKIIYALLTAILLWVIPLLIFRTAIDIRPMSVLAIQLAALPPLLFRYWLFMKRGN